MSTPKACLTRTIHAPGLGSAASPAPAIGHGMAMPMPEHERQRERQRRAAGVEAARKQHHLNDDRRDACAGEQRRHGPHHERQAERAALGRVLHPARIAREVDVDDVEHRQASTTNSAAIARLNHGDALMVPNVPAVRITTRPSTP